MNILSSGLSADEKCDLAVSKENLVELKALVCLYSWILCIFISFEGRKTKKYVARII